MHDCTSVVKGRRSVDMAAMEVEEANSARLEWYLQCSCAVSATRATVRYWEGCSNFGQDCCILRGNPSY